MEEGSVHGGNIYRRNGGGAGGGGGRTYLWLALVV